MRDFNLLGDLDKYAIKAFILFAISFTVLFFIRFIIIDDNTLNALATITVQSFLLGIVGFGAMIVYDTEKNDRMF